jgi:hypothetical protein
MGLLISSKKDYFNYLSNMILLAIITAFIISLLKKRSRAKQCSQLSFLNTTASISTTISKVMVTQSFLKFYQIFENKILFKRRFNMLTLIFQLCVIFIILNTKCIMLFFYLFLNYNTCSLLYDMTEISNFISCLYIYFTLNHTSNHKL